MAFQIVQRSCPTAAALSGSPELPPPASRRQARRYPFTLLCHIILLRVALRLDDYTGYYYGPDHPMKPQRIAMTHQLILGYGLHKHLDVYVSRCRPSLDART